MRVDDLQTVAAQHARQVCAQTHNALVHNYVYSQQSSLTRGITRHVSYARDGD